MFTILEKKGRLRGLKVAFIGDGNNMAHSWLYGASKVGTKYYYCIRQRNMNQSKIVNDAIGKWQIIFGSKLDFKGSLKKGGKGLVGLYFTLGCVGASLGARNLGRLREEGRFCRFPGE